jgi:acetyltransferase
MAEALDKQPRPRGPRLTILTNAGGPGVLATDALLAEGGSLAELTPETITALNHVLPPHWSHQNPIDIIGDAGPERYAKAVEIAAQDPSSDGLLVALTPQGMTSPAEIAERLKPFAKLDGKPILASWMGGAEVAAGEAILNRAGIPTFPYPDTAARAFQYMWRYSDNLKGLYETPSYDAGPTPLERQEAGSIIRAARQEGRTLLTELESKRLLSAYGIPTVQTLAASSEERAVEMARQIGYPVVLKLHSKTITHKTDVGGVHLNLSGDDMVREAYRSIERSVRDKAGEGHFDGVTVQPMIRDDAYELILGSSIDSQLGPVILFGCGGQLVEVFRDRALGLPPLNSTLARRMMERTRIFRALQGVRGRKPVDLRALDELVVQFSQLVVEQRAIREIDINPLLASAGRLLALDARVVLQPAEMREEEMPKLAIRPYPYQYVRTFTMKEGANVTIRPIRPEDEPMMVRFHGTLSEDTVHSRYFHLMKLSQRVEHDRLTRVCFIDYDRETALVAERSEGGEREILAVGRLTRIRVSAAAEFAILVSDKWQHQGLGSELLRRLIDVARAEGIEEVKGFILPENRAMERICRELGFTAGYDMAEGVLRATLDVRAAGNAPAAG